MAEHRDRSSRSVLAIALGLVVVTGCAGPLEPSPVVLSPTPAAGDVQPSPRIATPPATAARTSATPAPQPGPIAGVWRVRKVLSIDDRSALIPSATYDDEAYVLTPGCDTEPCPTVEVTMTPLGAAAPATVATLQRDGDTYVSAATVENDGPCLNGEGDRVPGGATVSSTLRLWLSRERPAGSSVESTLLQGTAELLLTPTPIGAAGGCERQTAAYVLSGRRETVAVGRPGSPDGRPPTGASLTSLPAIDVSVAGAVIDYFSIEGDTALELIASLARGGVKACGAINYEWHRGDDRPAACAVTRFLDPEDSIEQRTNRATGACTIAKANVKARHTIHVPRWTKPARVPTRLVDWWRRVVTFIGDHEGGHIRINRDHLKKLNTRLLGADCSDVDSIIRSWAKRVNGANEDFDRREYAKPWPVPPPGY